MPPPALEPLYDEHAPALFAFLLQFTRHEADTRDLLQELFIKLARSPGLLDGVRDVRPFLLRLAHNAAIDLLRRRAKAGLREGISTMPAPRSGSMENSPISKISSCMTLIAIFERQPMN